PRTPPTAAPTGAAATTTRGGGVMPLGDPSDYLDPVYNSEQGGQGISVPFAEMGQEDGSSPEYNLSWEGASSRRTFLVAGSDMVQAVGEALGYSWISPSGKLRRWLPEYDPNFPWLVAKKLVPPYRGIRYEGSEDPGTGYGPVNLYKKAQLTFEYGFRNFD